MESDSYSIVSKEILQLLIGEKREYSNYPPDKKYVNLDLSLNWKNIQKTCSFFEGKIEFKLNVSIVEK